MQLFFPSPMGRRVWQENLQGDVVPLQQLDEAGALGGSDAISW